ncbi:STAS domain-containing protein [Plastorhodobacter daqingensis]|uniref:STAS domain-containing protein n=1 Tax=Plastorhodobacter daqingensis TaxID=1387281 RepID=A0ABW2UND6_9RHOB
MANIMLSGDLGIKDAAGLIRKLNEALMLADVTVETRDVRSADSAVAQVLVAAFRSAGMMGRSLCVTLPPEAALSQLLRRLGLVGEGGPLIVAEGRIIGIEEGTV